MTDVSAPDELNRRLKPLLDELRPPGGPCPFVVDPEAAGHVDLSHYSGGRDATYVLVSRKRKGDHPLPDLAATIRYAPFVEGTTIIYDLVAETMQGKARPFVCDLSHRLSRVYALLPFQLEATELRVEDSSDGRRVNVVFHDARGELIQAALPFELRLLGSDGQLLLATCGATSQIGRQSKGAAVPHPASKAVVRSLLSGAEHSLVLQS